MLTRIEKFFNAHSINKAGMMTRSQKRQFQEQYGDSALKQQERRKIFSLSSVQDTISSALVRSEFAAEKVKNLLTHGRKSDFWEHWISPSQMKFYFESDPFMYVVKNRPILTQPSVNVKEQMCDELNFQDKLRQDGILFEKCVYDFYKKKFTSAEVTTKAEFFDLTLEKNIDMLFITNEDHDSMVCNEEKRDITEAAILQGVPIICQGVLWNPEMKLFGIADLIVRSDYLPHFVDNFKQTENDEGLDIKAKNVPFYHYRVIDIKSKSIEILKDGFSLSSNEKHRFYKAQLWTYNSIVSKIQGYDSHMAYILGKRAIHLHTKNSCFNEVFGVVDFKGKDKNVEHEVKECIGWIHQARKFKLENVMKLKLPLPHMELYPNMRKMHDETKAKFASKIKEITSIYFCGKAQRNKAIEKGYFSYEDPNVDAAMLGFKDSHRQKCVNTDLLLSRTTQVIYPKKEDGLKTSFFREPKEYFAAVDMEFMSQHDFSNLPHVRQTDIVFMIGFYGKNITSGIEREKTFTVTELSEVGEKAMVKEFIAYVKAVSSNMAQIPLHHWGDVDLSQWEKLMQKYLDLFKDDIAQFIFFDMSQICKEEPIMVKDAHGFGLKSYVKNMVNKGIFTSTVWDKLDCINGNDAVCYMTKASQECVKNGTKLLDHPLVREVEKYNKADCKAIFELYQGLKNYYD